MFKYLYLPRYKIQYLDIQVAVSRYKILYLYLDTFFGEYLKKYLYLDTFRNYLEFIWTLIFFSSRKRYRSFSTCNKFCETYYQMWCRHYKYLSSHLWLLCLDFCHFYLAFLDVFWNAICLHGTMHMEFVVFVVFVRRATRTEDYKSWRIYSFYAWFYGTIMHHLHWWWIHHPFVIWLYTFQLWLQSCIGCHFWSFSSDKGCHNTFWPISFWSFFGTL